MPNPARRTHSHASILAACLVIAASAPAQQSTVEATTPSQTGQPQFTIRARVPLTIVDVVVTDAKGHPVHGLKQSDFTILEDNQPMHPNSFEEHRSDDEAPPTELIQLNLPPNTFTNKAPASVDRPVNVLLLDSLNTPLQTQQVVVLHMLDLVKRMQPDTLMAVFTLTTHLSIVQGFTTDRELLKAAINSKKNMPQAAPLEDRAQDIANTDDPACMAEIEHMASRAQYTMTAMSQLARYLEGIPGHKNLIWFGGSFPLADSCADRFGQDSYDLTDEMKTATDRLARARVTAFPIDSRGLDVPKPKKTLEHLTMESIADQTGGTATYTSNDLAGAANDAINSGANFYTLTYTPANQTLDTRFRSIKVKADQPNLHLVYRNGYYATAPDETITGKKIDKVTPMQAALMRGSLEPTQILFKVNVTQSPTIDARLSADNQPDPKQMKPPYRHYSIAYVIDVHGIDFSPSPDGNYRGGFEYGVRVYNADGDEIVNSVSKIVNPILPPTVYKSMLNGGANAHQEIDLPATGNYFLRIAVHDLATDHVGAIEIPAASITANPTPTNTTQ